MRHPCPPSLGQETGKAVSASACHSIVHDGTGSTIAVVVSVLGLKGD